MEIKQVLILQFFKKIPDDFAVFQLFCYTRLLVADRLSLLTSARHGPASAILKNVNKQKWNHWTMKIWKMCIFGKIWILMGKIWLILFYFSDTAFISEHKGTLRILSKTERFTLPCHFPDPDLFQQPFPRFQFVN